MKSLWDLLWKGWYPILTRLTRNVRVTFLNYGYADAGTSGPELAEADEPDRVCIQLYHRVAGAVDLRGLTVLEVSCGHGGGASYVARYLKPASVHGVDRNAAAVDQCKARHRADGLTFSTGDAQALKLPDDHFDAVINVEASHCYPDVPGFLREMRRVLRPGGHFLYADFRHVGPDLTHWKAQLAASGMDLVRCDDISPHVVRGMELRQRPVTRTGPHPRAETAVGVLPGASPDSGDRRSTKP